MTATQTGGILRIHSRTRRIHCNIDHAARRSADAGRRRLMHLTSRRPIQWAELPPPIVLASERSAQSVAQAGAQLPILVIRLEHG